MLHIDATPATWRQHAEHLFRAEHCMFGVVFFLLIARSWKTFNYRLFSHPITVKEGRDKYHKDQPNAPLRCPASVCLPFRVIILGRFISTNDLFHTFVSLFTWSFDTLLFYSRTVPYNLHDNTVSQYSTASMHPEFA